MCYDTHSLYTNMFGCLAMKRETYRNSVTLPRNTFSVL